MNVHKDILKILKKTDILETTRLRVLANIDITEHQLLNWIFLELNKIKNVVDQCDWLLSWYQLLCFNKYSLKNELIYRIEDYLLNKKFVIAVIPNLSLDSMCSNVSDDKWDCYIYYNDVYHNSSFDIIDRHDAKRFAINYCLNYLKDN
jgi:hypothetical protein